MVQVQRGMRHSSTKQMIGKLKGGLGAIQAKPGTAVHKPMHATESAKHNGKVCHPALRIATSSACSFDSTCGGSSENGDSRPTSPMMSTSFVEQATFSAGSSLHHSGGCNLAPGTGNRMAVQMKGNVDIAICAHQVN